MPDFQYAPYVSSEFVNVHVDVLGAEIRSIVDGISPSYLVVTDAGRRFLFGTDDLHELMDNLEAGDAVAWTGADLVERSGADPSVVVEVTIASRADTVIDGPALDGSLRHPFLVAVDDVVQLIVDTHPVPVTDAVPEIDQLLVQARDVAPAAARDWVTVDAWAGGDLVRLGPDPVALPGGAGPVPPCLPGPDDVSGLQIIVPQQVGRNATVELVAMLVRGADADADLRFSAETGDQISVVVWPEGGLTIQGSSSGVIDVTGQVGDADSVTFHLTITGVDRASAIVDVYRGQTFLGNALVDMQVVLGTPTSPPRSIPVPILPADAPRSDLAIHIVDATDPVTHQRILRFVAIEPGKAPIAFPPQPLRREPIDVLAPLLSSIDRSLAPAPNTPASPTTPDNVVRAIGLMLAEEILPSRLREYLWTNRSLIESIVVHTDEPYIPWELCLVTHTSGPGATEEVGFLCELFELTRWRPGIAARERLSMTSIGVLAPVGSGLASMKAEVKMLQGLATPQRKVGKIRATTEQVYAALESTDYDVLHFIGHGSFPDPRSAGSSQAVLAGKAYLTPGMVGGKTGNFGARNPLVFLNACRLGAGSAGLVGPSGWAHAMLSVGSAAFVGAHWNVVDESAHVFATHLYQGLVAGDTIGHAAREARLATKQAGDPTWLAYAVYASPNARIADTVVGPPPG